MNRMAAAANGFEDGPAPEYGKDLVARIRQRRPNVFLVCLRDKNRNVVVYEARIKDKKLLDPPVEAYWLILEPSYQEPRRRQGLVHDREELGFLDHKFGWGFEARRKSDTEAQFTFKAFRHDMTVKVADNGREAYLLTTLDQRKYMMQQMYVKASDNIRLLNLQDNVKSILLKGLDITDKPPYKHVDKYLKGGPES